MPWSCPGLCLCLVCLGLFLVFVSAYYDLVSASYGHDLSLSCLGLGSVMVLVLVSMPWSGSLFLLSLPWSQYVPVLAGSWS
ncbi:hypothetical protein DNTS_023456 [Danionella cerebrum]|uniref:NADH dehydrogenase subunit 6 n=1 Tax=Danionella cerebrum TaxID=2873325 RepID=A0A553RP85_9TELE|nr:hypothetical protein DNTS_023456 [Danionella translucida]